MTGLVSGLLVKQRGDLCLHSRGMVGARLAVRFALSKRRGRRESRVRAAPAVSRANCAKKCAHEHTGPAEAFRLSLRDGLTAYFGLSPVNGLCCHRRPQKPGFLRTWRQHRGARTTRLRRTRQLRSSVTALASTASHRAFVTIATRPSHRVRRAESKTDSPPSLSDLFFSEGLDEAKRVDIADEFSLNAHAPLVEIVASHRLAKMRPTIIAARRFAQLDESHAQPRHARRQRGAAERRFILRSEVA